MLCVTAVSVYLGTLLGVFIPGDVDYKAYRRLIPRLDNADDVFVEKGILKFSRCLGILLCIFFSLFYRNVVGRMQVLVSAIIFLSTAFALMTWPWNLPIYTPLFLAHTVSKFVIWLSMSQIAAVAEINDEEYNAGLLMGAFMRSGYFPDIACLVTVAALCISYVVFHSRLSDISVVREGFLNYQSIYSRYGDRYFWTDWWGLACAHHPSLYFGFTLGLMGFLVKREPKAFTLAAFLLQVRLLGVNMILACIISLAAFLVICAGFFNYSIYCIVGFPIFCGAGCALRNYALDAFEVRDVFVGNTLCIVALAFAMSAM